MSVLTEPGLVLNSGWQAIGFISVEDCIVNVTRGRACVVHPITFAPLSFDEWVDQVESEIGTEFEIPDLRWIKTSSSRVPAPEVIVLKEYGKRPPRKIGYTRGNLWKRDQYSCQYCGVALPGSKLQIEHVVPRSRGGPTTWLNTVAACGKCNSHKADRLPSEAGMTLRKQPHRPRWTPKLPVPGGKLRDPWIPFLKAEGIEIPETTKTS